MKRFTKKLAVLGFAVAMGAATVGSLAAKSAKSFALASAADYEQIEVTVTEMRIHWNWVGISLSEFDGPSAQEMNETAMFTDHASYNYENNIIVNDDDNLPLNDRSSNVYGYNLGGDHQTEIVLAQSSLWGNGANAASISKITIKAGTEFPSYQTTQGGAKKTYVLKEDAIFWNVACSWSANYSDTTFTPDSLVTFIDTEVTNFSISAPNPSWPGFELSVNDYPAEGSGTMYDFQNFKAGVGGIKVFSKDGYSTTGAEINLSGPGTMAFLHYNNAPNYISYQLGTHANWTQNFISESIVYVPKGTWFPSLESYANRAQPLAQKKLFRTTEDVWFVGKKEYLDGNSAYVRIVPTYENNRIVEIGGLTPFEQNGVMFTNFTFELEHNNSPLAGTNTPALWSFVNLINQAKFYNAESNLIDLRSTDTYIPYVFGAQFADFGTHQYLSQLMTDVLGATTKIVFPKGTVIPSIATLQGKSNVLYVLNEDNVFIHGANGLLYCKDTLDAFVETYMHFDDYGSTQVGEGKCVSEGWYATAKAAFNALPLADRVGLQVAPYTDTFFRLVAWARANGEDFKGTTITFDATANFNRLVEEPSSNVAIILITAIAAVSAIAVLMLLKKKKETK